MRSDDAARPAVRLAALAAAFAVLAACDNGSSPFGDNGFDREFTVLTRNLYVGTDIFAVAEAQDNAELVAKVTEAWAGVQATDFPARAEALAAEIAAADPHMVGLQEVSLFRLQSPGDLPGLVPAQDTVLDFLPVLMAELDSLGLDYDVAVESKNADVEMPLLDDQGGLDDIRLTDRDVVLVRSDVDWTEAQHGQYADRNVIVVAGGLPIPFFRSWTSVVVTIAGRKIRFVNTHLETQIAPSIQQAQGDELLTLLAGETRPIVLLGDFNSQADGTGTATYSRIRQSAYDDAWSAGGGGDGPTCCHAEDLLNDVVTLDQRIDLVFLSASDFEVLDVEVVGDELADRTPAGLWPSDHAGVVAKLKLRT